MAHRVRDEIARQRFELLKIGKMPAVVHLGTDELREFKHELPPGAPFFVHQTMTAAEPRVMYDGMELFERLKPGVHVSEATP